MKSRDRKFRLAVLASHPIEYQGPLFREIAKEPGIDLHVYYCWKFGVKKPTFDPGFGQKIKWDIPLLEGYSFSFLQNWSLKPSGRFLGEINPGIILRINKKRHDALLVLGWSSMTSWLGYLAALFCGTPFFVRGENPLNQEFGKPAWKRLVKKFPLRFLFRGATAILYIGKENRKFYEYYGAPKEKLFFAPYAVDNERFMREAENLRPQKNNFKKELGIAPGEPVILFAGKLIDKKRPLDLLKAYELLLTKNYKPKTKNYPQPALVFVGDGPLRSEVEIYIKENRLRNVFVTGYINQGGMPRFYVLADVFVLPSGQGETWGMVINEAMCFGLPIIISDVVGSAPDLVEDDENGFIFPMGDIEALAGALAKILGADEKKERVFKKKSLEIIQKYSYEEDIKQIVRLTAGLKKSPDD